MKYLHYIQNHDLLGKYLHSFLGLEKPENTYLTQEKHYIWIGVGLYTFINFIYIHSMI